MSTDNGLTIAMTLFGVTVTSMFIVLNIYKPSALIAFTFLYLVVYSVLVISLLNNYKKSFGKENTHYTLNWYISFLNIFMGVVMFALYFIMPSRRDT